MKLLVIAYFVVATIMYACGSLVIEKTAEAAEGYASRLQVELAFLSMALLWPKTVIELIGAIDEINDNLR
jgi:hypothetical protein